MADTTDSQLTKLDDNTVYNGLVISNDWPVIPNDAQYYARLDPAGSGQSFFYKGAGATSPVLGSDGQPLTGPVNFSCKTVYVTVGATVEGCEFLDLPFGRNVEIWVQDGGTLTNCNIYNGTVKLYGGALSEYNYNVSTKYNIDDGGISRNDSFVEPGNVLAVFNNPNISGGQAEVGTGDGNSEISVVSGGVMESATFPNIKGVNPSASKVPLGVYIGAKINLPPDYSSIQFNAINVTNEDPILWGGNWTAKVVDGKTVYTDGTTTHDGPVNLLTGANLTIENGAVVDGLNAFSNVTITVANGGTIQNSNIYSADNVDIQSGSMSKNNTYVSSTVTLNNGGASDSDGFYWIPNNKEKSESTFTNSNLTTYMPDSNGIISFDTSTQTGSTVGLNGNTSANIVNPIFDAQNSGGIWVYPYGGENDYPCFLAGSLIETVNGNIAVEDLKVGDQVCVLTSEGKKLQAITSVVVGNHYVVNPQFDDVGGYPVCIQKDAISENVPSQDLLVTPDHCLFFEGKFIPARMLVNRRSIYYDRSQTKYTYYHIETGEHSVITANGMLTESFLDTVNHKAFRGNVIRMPKTWAKDAAAPLIVDRASVKPVFNMIADRAVENDVADKYEELLLTNDHDIHLITDNGQVISRIIDNEKITFVIPKDTRSVRIVSRSSRPSDTIGPFIDDRRSLGVLIKNITIFNKNKSFNVDTHLTTKELAGWHNLENSSLRWTNGDAFLSVENYCKGNNSVLVINVVAGGPYLVEDNKNIVKLAV